jgi:hypothetical protein
MNNTTKPGDFPLGSLESRAAARSVLNALGLQSAKLVVRVEYIGFPGCGVQYIVDESGTTKTGREPTMEEFKAHPALQNCDIDALRGKRLVGQFAPAGSDHT